MPLTAMGMLLGTALMITAAMAAPGSTPTGAYPSLKSCLGSPLPAAEAKDAVPLNRNSTTAVFNALVFGKGVFSLPVITAPDMNRFSLTMFTPDSTMYTPFANLTGSGNITAFEDISPSGSAFLFEDIGPSGSLEPFEDVSGSGSTTVFEDFSPSGSTLPWDDISPSGSSFDLEI